VSGYVGAGSVEEQQQHLQQQAPPSKQEQHAVQAFTVTALQYLCLASSTAALGNSVIAPTFQSSWADGCNISSVWTTGICSCQAQYR
jgi:hypothetical protein